MGNHRSRKRGRQRLPDRRRRRRVALIAASLELLGLGIGAGQELLPSVMARVRQVPPRRTLPADSIVLDRSGRLLADLHPPGETRIPISIDRMAPSVLQATVAIEDREFWTEGVVAPKRVIGSIWQDLLHRRMVQGASTITEQLARILYLDRSMTLERKTREIVVGQRMVAQMSKSKILQEYLNDIYYGRGATGIESAARVYFNIDAIDLDLAQSAMLAGLPVDPNDLNPLHDPQAARARQRQVLCAMVNAGVITETQNQAARTEPLSFSSGPPGEGFTTAAPAFVRRVTDWVAELSHDPYRDGLTITTTIDLRLQTVASKAVATEVDRMQHARVSDGALLSLDPRSGDIIAYVGSSGPGHPGWLNDMTRQPRQPGIAFSIFAYTTALAERKISLETPLVDAPYGFAQGGGTEGNEPYQVPLGAGATFHGVVPAGAALASGLPVPALKVQQIAGGGNVVDTVRNMGALSLDRRKHAYSQSLSLGVYPMPLTELAVAGAVLAGGGTVHTPRSVLSVRDASGRELWAANDTGQQVVQPEVAYLVNSALRHDHAPGSSASSPGTHGLAVLSDTSADLRDSVTLGWTPTLVTASWIGNADSTPMLASGGVPSSKVLWQTVMDGAPLGRDEPWPGAPPGLALTPWGGYFLPGSDRDTVPGLGRHSTPPASPYPRGREGYDVSWPQCGGPSVVGRFSIVGTNSGKPFTDNPCFQSQSAAASVQAPPSLYLLAGYKPEYRANATPQCLTAARRVLQNDRDETRVAWAIGCSEAMRAMAASAGPQDQPLPRTWWVDVEAPYPDSLAGANWSIDETLNRHTIAGAIYFLQAKGDVVGIYSTAQFWSRITGDWVIADGRVPNWVAGVASIQHTCDHLGFSGGPVWLVQYYRKGMPSGDHAC
jgi:membrane peptidoglycan carboxypeptidase